MSASSDLNPSPLTKRFHDLDALRAFAMLLGLVLHGVMSFIEIPIWPAQDIHQNSEIYGFILAAVHGFRMPLFFLISGFFTAMMWKKRGMKGLLKNRAIRILVPLVAGSILLWPIMAGIHFWGEADKKKNAAAVSEKVEGSPTGVSVPESRDINALDSFGVTSLSRAAMRGELATVEDLVERGAKVNAANADGNTPLHAAAFFGRSEVVAFLLESGADARLMNAKGETALDAARAPRVAVEWVADILDMEVDMEAVNEGHKVIMPMLAAEGGGEISGSVSRAESAYKTLVGLWTLGAMLPFFHHLWFLHYLFLLVIFFLVLAPLFSRLPSRAKSALGHPVLCWLWILPLTFFAQYLMRQTFGPDTATGILPWPPKLLYYSVFFGFGAIVYGGKTFETQAGKFWPLLFFLAAPTLLGGLYCFEIRNENINLFHPIASLLSVVYAWLMIFGMIGVFRRFFSRESSKIRYISDSAYWLYLAHLPLMMALQICVSSWEIPSLIKLLGILAITSTLLLLAYEYLIRYSWIGTILNGRKSRSRRPST